jgi:hypothetical protein
VSDLPEYLDKGARLPRGGPDRVRLCFWYADELDKGKEHTEALEVARNYLRLMHWHIAFGCAVELGPTAAGIPIEFIGESDEVRPSPQR